jgi:hypothetical protein
MVEYSRRLYEDVLSWYRNADSKAQIILTLDGVLLGFLTSTILANPGRVKEVILVFGTETWVLILLMSVTLVGSVISAEECLRSRTYRTRQLRKEFGKLGVDPAKQETYRAEVIWFFQMVAGLDKASFQSFVRNSNANLEVDVLTGQAFELSKRVSEKHRWVNRAFLFTGASLCLLLLIGVSWVIRLQ